MADISLADIKALRDRLGTGMVDTKNALVEAEGDIEKAVEILRLKGAKGNAKRADRSTSEGLIAAVESATATTMIELACETDFVAKNEKFVELGNKVLQALADSGAETLDAALAVPLDGGTVASVIDDQAAIIGEKVELRRVVRIPGEKFAVYLHRTSKDLPPQIGVVVAYTGDDAETARSIAQHISFADPQYLGRDDVPTAEVENERRIVEEISLTNRQRADVSAGTDIAVADAVASGAEQKSAGRRVVEQIAVMLLSRNAYRAGIDPGEFFHGRIAAVDQNALQRRFRQSLRDPLAHHVEEINRHSRKEAVAHVKALRNTVESERNQCLVSRS